MNRRHCRCAWSVLLAAQFAIMGCQRAAGPVERTQSREIMGTFANLSAVAADAGSAHAALAAGYARLDDVNRLMSDYVDDSEVGRLNQLDAGESLALSPETFTCIQRALRVNEISGGAFDITCRPLVWLWKGCGKEGRLPTADEMRAARAKIGSQHVVLDAATRQVRKEIDGLQIDLGAIAKGYALDLAGEAMRASGAQGALIDVGGDVLALGRSQKGEPWRIGVRHPFAEGVIVKLALENRAVATSGNQQRFYDIDGKRYSHIVDPRTGWPVEQAPSVTVIANDGITADAWSTVLSVLSVEEGRALVATDAAPEIEALWIQGGAKSPRMEKTDGFDAYVIE